MGSRTKRPLNVGYDGLVVRIEASKSEKELHLIGRFESDGDRSSKSSVLGARRDHPSCVSKS